MPKKKKQDLPRLSPGEMPIMEIVWNEEETTIRHVWESLTQLGYEQTRATVQVQIGRLELKGWLTKRKEGRTYFYRSTKDGEEARYEIAEDMTKTLFGSSVSKLIRCLSGGGKKLSSEEVDDLQKLIDSQRKS